MYLVRSGIVLIAALAMSLLAAACDDDGERVRGSGSVITEEFEFADFTSVDASNAFEVDIVQSETFSVSIRVDDNVLDLLDVSREGDTLKLGLESGVSLTDSTLEASITMPDLEALSLSGAASATVSEFRSEDRIDLDLSGASNLDGDLQAGSADLDVSGASRVTLTGSAGDLTIVGSGASNLDLADFAADTAGVDLSGATEATLTVNERIDSADVSGASTMRYLGDPELENVTTSGGSTVEKGS